MVRDFNTHCLRGYSLSRATSAKVQTQGFNIKESKLEDSKSKKLKTAEGKTPAPPRSESTEPGKTSCTNKKREYLKKKQDRKNNTPATGNNTNAIEGKKK